MYKSKDLSFSKVKLVGEKNQKYNFTDLDFSKGQLHRTFGKESYSEVIFFVYNIKIIT